MYSHFLCCIHLNKIMGTAYICCVTKLHILAAIQHSAKKIGRFPVEVTIVTLTTAVPPLKPRYYGSPYRKCYMSEVLTKRNPKGCIWL